VSTPDNPGYGQPPPSGQTWQPGHPRPTANGLGVAALVIGVISLPFSLVVVGGFFGLVAVVLGFLARGRAKRGEADNPGVALAGILTGGLAVLIAIGLVLALTVFLNSHTGRTLRHCLHAYKDKAAQEQCERDAGITPVVTKG
jgi:hypothetical protein